MATTADPTFRIDGQDVDTLIIQGRERKSQLYIKGSHQFYDWGDTYNDPNLGSDDILDFDPSLIFPICFQVRSRMLSEVHWTVMVCGGHISCFKIHK